MPIVDNVEIIVFDHQAISLAYYTEKVECRTIVMKVEVGRFYDGDLKVLVRFEPNSNFWKETLTWVPTIREIELILNTFLGIDVVNRWKKYRRNSRYRE